MKFLPRSNYQDRRNTSRQLFGRTGRLASRSVAMCSAKSSGRKRYFRGAIGDIKLLASVAECRLG
ncbi:hypothetical protein CGZ80_03435 [Rhodopirellula sp. MGV]|nr:hypothetical protein CGZ80_03435 [Rhodopirellula sp. MGV]